MPSHFKQPATEIAAACATEIKPNIPWVVWTLPKGEQFLPVFYQVSCSAARVHAAALTTHGIYIQGCRPGQGLASAQA